MIEESTELPTRERGRGGTKEHELRELLELRPLVVRLLYRNLNLNRVVDPRHAFLLPGYGRR